MVLMGFMALSFFGSFDSFKNPAHHSLFFLLLFFQRRQTWNVGCSVFRCCWRLLVKPAFKRYFPLANIWGIIWFLCKMHPNAAPRLSHFPFCVLISCRSLARGQGWKLGTALWQNKKDRFPGARWIPSMFLKSRTIEPDPSGTSRHY